MVPRLWMLGVKRTSRSVTSRQTTSNHIGSVYIAMSLETCSKNALQQQLLPFSFSFVLFSLPRLGSVSY